MLIQVVSGIERPQINFLNVKVYKRRTCKNLSGIADSSAPKSKRSGCRRFDTGVTVSEVVEREVEPENVDWMGSLHCRVGSAMAIGRIRFFLSP